MRKTLLYLFLLSIHTAISSANPGDGSFESLTFANSSRITALGGSNISLQTEDLNLAFQNPALLTDSLDKTIAANYTNYVGDINMGSAGYAQSIDSLNYFGACVSYINYGSFDGYDEYGIKEGNFYANDIMLSAVYARKLSTKITAGLAVKPEFSQIDSYTAIALGIDIGGNYYDKDLDFSVSIAIKNIGVQLKSFDSDNRKNLHWNLQAGLTKRLAHAPFRFSITFSDLNNWNLEYERMPNLDKKDINLSGASANNDNEINFFDMLFRHTIIGIEFIPSKNFNILAAYNHRKQKEFEIENTKSANGFSFGANIKVSKFNIGVSYAINAPAGGSLGISVQTCLNHFK